MHILVPPPGPAFYLMHAWVWQDNPAGMFADWNPTSTADRPAGGWATRRVRPGAPHRNLHLRTATDVVRR